MLILVLGIVGYAILCFLALMWLIGVRVQLSAGAHTILGSLAFFVAAVIIPVSQISFLHAWWMIPASFGVAIVSAILISVPVIGKPLILLASLYAGIVRIGIDPENIRAAQLLGAQDAVESWATKRS